MFFSDEFWKNEAFGALIGGIITVVLLKLWEKLRMTGARNKSKKGPTEHDERFC